MMMNILVDRPFSFVAIIIGLIIVFALYWGHIYIIILYALNYLCQILDILKNQIFSCFNKHPEPKVPPSQRERLMERMRLIKQENEDIEIVIAEYKNKDKDQALIYDFINEVAKKKRMREN